MSVDFPAAFYLDAMANLHLGRLDVAEASVQKAQRILDIEGQVDRFYKKLTARQTYVESKKAHEAARKSPERPIADLGLSARATEALAKAGITEVSHSWRNWRRETRRFWRSAALARSR
jgi:DNA-directed RNA polymerase alpha subunit